MSSSEKVRPLKVFDDSTERCGPRHRAFDARQRNQTAQWGTVRERFEPSVEVHTGAPADSALRVGCADIGEHWWICCDFCCD